MFLLHKEERTSVIKPLAVESNEGTGSMGDDTALAVMSKCTDKYMIILDSNSPR